MIARFAVSRITPRARLGLIEINMIELDQVLMGRPTGFLAFAVPAGKSADEFTVDRVFELILNPVE